MSVLNQQRPPTRVVLAMWLAGSTTALVAGRSADRSAQASVAQPPAPVCSGAVDPCPQRLALLPTDPGVAGVRNSFPATGATPGGSVAYYLGRPAGTSQVELLGCPAVTLDIGLARGLGRANADSDGNATLTRTIPDIFSGLTLATQVIDVTTCAPGNEQSASY